jgi:hypothetical protein
MADNHDTLTGRGFSKRNIENLAMSELIGCTEERVGRNV